MLINSFYFGCVLWGRKFKGIMMSCDNFEKYIDIFDLWSFVFICIDFFLYYYELLKKKMLLG